MEPAYDSSTSSNDNDGTPVFTAQDEAREIASLSISELTSIRNDLTGAAAFSDAYASAVASASRADIPAAVARLNHEMFELPASQTGAYYQAVETRPELVCHERKLMFLDYENGDVTLAAKRLAKYWEDRLEIFGPDRCFLPMTLRGAMRDQAMPMARRQIWQPVPVTDAVGRTVFYFCPSRRNFSEYSPREEAMDAWYQLETLLEDEDLRRRGVVVLGDLRNMQRDHYCREMETFLGKIVESVPVPIRALHFCHPSKVVLYIVLPMTKYLMPRSIRLRQRVHSGSEKQVLMSLEAYGLPQDRMPTELGGSVVLDINQWMLDRLEIESTENGQLKSTAPILPTASAWTTAATTTKTARAPAAISGQEYTGGMSSARTSAYPTGAVALPTAAVRDNNSATNDTGLSSSSSDHRQAARKKPRIASPRDMTPAPTNNTSPVARSGAKTKDESKKKRRDGRGNPDPRMTKAIEARLSDPLIPLFDALVAGGYTFTQSEGMQDMVDADGITLQQRKNNLCRRIRSEKKKRGIEDKAKPAPVERGGVVSFGSSSASIGAPSASGNRAEAGAAA
eukprot:CAMPEP_0178478282 /NCGR_PEP_ID=MMETSP0696-20121128/4579_1 /TAXON_ID=265572 /ORGANISM="Extubocellulus spinifer, Strain CCMP396" /LENGTH=566 /DNA_ID=CAMNT_0020105645 /DNA_START=69 /DNA_END=1765 /DNA_ORIENTATION=-